MHRKALAALFVLAPVQRNQVVVRLTTKDLQERDDGNMAIDVSPSLNTKTQVAYKLSLSAELSSILRFYVLHARPVLSDGTHDKVFLRVSTGQGLATSHNCFAIVRNVVFAGCNVQAGKVHCNWQAHASVSLT